MGRFVGSAVAVGPDISAGASSGGLSVQALSDDGFFEFTDSTGTGEFWIGLGTNAAYDLGMSHAFEFGAVVGIRESGTYRMDFPRTAGSVYRLLVEGTTVTYYKDSVLKYTSLVPVTLPKKLDVGFFSSGGSVFDAVVSVVVDNDAPDVDAGPDQSISFGNAATLSGSVSDDGLPEGSTLVIAWSQISGPGITVFADASDPSTEATPSLPGTYVLRLTATDGDLTAYDEVTVTATIPTITRRTPRIFLDGVEITTSVRS